MQIKTPSPFPSKTANKFFRTPSNPIFLLTIIPLSHHTPSSLAPRVCRVNLLGKELQQYTRLTGIPLRSQICDHLNYSLCARLTVIPLFGFGRERKTPAMYVSYDRNSTVIPLSTDTTPPTNIINNMVHRLPPLWR
jgi:hypothetical protein